MLIRLGIGIRLPPTGRARPYIYTILGHFLTRIVSYLVNILKRSTKDMYLLCKLNFLHNESLIRVGHNLYIFLFINHSISWFTSLLNIPIVVGSLCGRTTTILMVYFGLSAGKQPMNVNSSELLLLSSHCRMLYIPASLIPLGASRCCMPVFSKMPVAIFLTYSKDDL